MKGSQARVGVDTWACSKQGAGQSPPTGFTDFPINLFYSCPYCVERAHVVSSLGGHEPAKASRASEPSTFSVRCRLAQRQLLVRLETI